MQQKGPGLATSQNGLGDGIYDPLALKQWKFYAPNEELPFEKASSVAEKAELWGDWGKWVVKRKNASDSLVVEEKIEPNTEERRLLQAWPDVANSVLY